jgi:hypothetical protein
LIPGRAQAKENLKARSSGVQEFKEFKEFKEFYTRARLEH